MINPSIPLLAAALLAAPVAASAQVEPLQPPATTTTNTTTTVIVPVQPAPAVPVQPAPAVVEVAPVPGEHFVDIELAVSRGSLEAYFGRAPRREAVEVGGATLTFKAPSTLTVTKLASRDKDSATSKKVTVDNPWIVRVPFSGPGRYVFNIVEWDNSPVVTAATVKLDGVVIFSGRGSEDDLDGWAVKTYGAGVNKTGDREIAFIVP